MIGCPRVRVQLIKIRATNYTSERYKAFAPNLLRQPIPVLEDPPIEFDGVRGVSSRRNSQPSLERLHVLPYDVLEVFLDKRLEIF